MNTDSVRESKFDRQNYEPTCLLNVKWLLTVQILHKCFKNHEKFKANKMVLKACIKYQIYQPDEIVKKLHTIK